MSYYLFLDDERHPVDQTNGVIVVIARTVAEAQAAVASLGVPSFVSFDHDLGVNEPTGYDFAKWLVDQHLDGTLDLKDFSFYVHSMNPVGAKNIHMLLTQFMDYIAE